jgi:acyl-CoA thioesterase-1
MSKFLLITFLVFNVFASEKVTKILFLGDSLTEGYGVKKEEAYPNLVEQSLIKKGYDVKIINGGISGSTSASGLSRLKWFLKAKPNILFLALGANDGLRGQKVEKVKLNLDKIISFAKEKLLKVVLAQMLLPPNYGKEYTDSFKELYSELAKKHKIVFIPFMLKDVGGVKEHNIEDGIHPNQKGHKILSDRVVSYLEKLL